MSGCSVFSTNQPDVGYVYGLLAAIVFGFNGSITKVVLEAGVSPTQLTFFRTLGMCAIAGLALVLIDRRGFRLSRRQVGVMAMLGLVGVALLQATYAFAIQLLPVGIALLFEYLAVLIVPMVALVWFKERVRGRLWVAIGLVLAGMAVVAEIWATTLDGIGMLWGLGAAACLATYFLIGERQVTATSPLAVAFWSSGFAALFWAVFSGWWQLDPAVLLQPRPLGGALSVLVVPVWMPLLWVVALGTFLPFVLSFAAIGRLRATAAGILASSEVVFAFAFAWLLLGEALSVPQLVGAAIVLAGIVLAQTARPRKALDADLAFRSDQVSF